MLGFFLLHGSISLWDLSVSQQIVEGYYRRGSAHLGMGKFKEALKILPAAMEFHTFFKADRKQWINYLIPVTTGVSSKFSNIGMPQDMTNPLYLQFNSAQQLVSCCGGLINNMGLRRNISVAVSLPEMFHD